MAKNARTSIQSATGLIHDVIGEQISSCSRIDQGQDGEKYVIVTDKGAKFFCRIKKVSESEELPFQESEVLMATNSPHIIKPTHAETVRGWYVIVRPYIEGVSLAERLRQVSFSEAEIERLAETLIEAAENLREVGAVHFDIKPDNIVVSAEGAFYLIDFGAAKMLEKMTTERIRPARKYIPPEVLQYLFDPLPLALHRLSILSDMYGIGAVLYECLTGVKISDVFQRASDILRKLPKPVLNINPRADARLAALADRLISKDPNQRLMPRDAQAFLQGTPSSAIAFPRFFLKTISGRGNEHTGMLNTITEDGDQVGLYFFCRQPPSLPDKTFIPRIIWEPKVVPAVGDIEDCLLSQQESGVIALTVPSVEVEGPIRDDVLRQNIGLVRAALDWRSANCPQLPLLAVISLDASLLTTTDVGVIRDAYAALDVDGVVFRVCVAAYGTLLNANQLRALREFITYWAKTGKPVMLDADINALVLSRSGVTSWIAGTSPRLATLQSRPRPKGPAQRPDNFYGKVLLGMLRPDDVISMRRTAVLRPVTECACRHCAGLRRQIIAGNWDRDDRRRHFLSIVPGEMERISALNPQEMRNQINNATRQAARFRPGIVINPPHLTAWADLLARD